MKEAFVRKSIADYPNYVKDDEKFKNLEDRVACLISNKTQEDFGITD